MKTDTKANTHMSQILLEVFVCIYVYCTRPVLGSNLLFHNYFFVWVIKVIMIISNRIIISEINH